MDQPLKVLILEDADYDAELIEYELNKLKTPVSTRRVATKAPFLRALGEFQPDLILADYRLPGFDGLTALALAQEECPEVPFIFVSGAMSPELAQRGLNQGAAACLPKNRLPQLATAVARTLRQLDSGEAPLRSSWSNEEHFWTDLLQTTARMMVVLSLDRTILEFNHGAELLTGWQRHEALGRDLVELLVKPGKRSWAKAKLAGVAAGEITRDFELPMQSIGGAACPCLCRLSLLPDRQGQPAVILLLAEDLSGCPQLERPPKPRAARTFTINKRVNLIC